MSWQHQLGLHRTGLPDAKQASENVMMKVDYVVRLSKVVHQCLLVRLLGWHLGAAFQQLGLLLVVVVTKINHKLENALDGDGHVVLHTQLMIPDVFSMSAASVHSDGTATCDHISVTCSAFNTRPTYSVVCCPSFHTTVGQQLWTVHLWMSVCLAYCESFDADS